MRYAPFQQRFRSVEDIKRFLSENFQPRCIEPAESAEEAHRIAGEVALAQRLIATIEHADAPDLASLVEE